VHDALIVAVKGLAGGTLVVLFALLAEGLRPKRFAGLFSAAPAVALVGLTITLLDKGPHQAHESAAGMIAGGAGMVAYAVAAVSLLRRVRAARASAAGLLAWAGVSALAALPLLA